LWPVSAFSSAQASAGAGHDPGCGFSGMTGIQLERSAMANLNADT
jgi:hypothetical protein